MSFAHERPGGHHVLTRLGDGRRSGTRFALKPHDPNHVPRDYADRPAIAEGRTLYRAALRVPDGRVLKPGANSSKLGARVLKGPWKGMPIFSLTLEERKTCPTDCPLWVGCYGNGMHLAKRYEHGPALERDLEREVYDLSVRFPRGFVVRLHILGDFYSLGYVDLWGALLLRHPGLHVFGYTARWNDPIGIALARLQQAHWPRFAIRGSGGHGPRTAVTVDRLEDVPEGAIVCPAQLGKTESCATCALCWGSERQIAFLRH